MFCQPVCHKVGYLPVVQFLEHKVAVAGDVLVWKIDHRGITAVSIVLPRKLTALVQNCLPKPCRVDVLRTIFNVVAKEEEHGHFGLQELPVFRRAGERAETRLNGNDGSHIIGISGPAHATALVEADADEAAVKETEKVDGLLTYALVQPAPSGKMNRYLCYQARKIEDKWKVTLLYLEGAATLDDLKNMFEKQ